MSENKHAHNNREHTKNTSNDTYELYYLEEKLGVSREQVQEAIKIVGNDRHKVEGYLRAGVKQ